MRCVPRFLSHRNARLGGGLSRESIEDLTQEVLARLWTKLSDYRGDATLETWAWRFCEFELRAAIRRAATRRVVAHVDPGSLTSKAAEERQAVGDPEGVHAALDELPVDEAIVVRKKHFDGLTFEEIAATLALSPNTVKTRYYRAAGRLQRWLGRENGA